MASQKLDPASKEGISNVVTSLAQAVAEKSASQLGIIKLAGVFSARRAKLDEVTFLDVLNFAHIIGAKGDGWDRYAQSILERTSQAAYYLFVMLNVLLTQLDSDVVKATERAKLKQLVAFVRAKRGYATMRPKQKQIQHFLDTFEQKDLIDKVKGTSAAGANES